MSTETKPYVTDERLKRLIINLNGRHLTKIKNHGPAAELAMEVRELYEAHLTELRRERDDAIPRSNVVELVQDLIMDARANYTAESAEKNMLLTAAKYGITI